MIATTRDAAFETLNTPLLRHFRSLVVRLGGDPDAVLRAAEVAADDFCEEAGHLTYRQAIRLLETAAQVLDCRDFGMRLALRQGGGSAFGPLGRIMRKSRTLGDAVKFASEHSHAHSNAARVWLNVGQEENTVFAGHELLLGHSADRAQAIEQILLLGNLGAMEMTGGYARARQIHFRHEPVSDPATYRHHFGCVVHFGEPADGMTFSAADFASPILGHDENIRRDMASCIEAQFPHRRLPFVAQVRGLIMRRLTLGDGSAAEVARALNLHVRTLSRRLADEGSSFQHVKDEVRRDLTYYYLQRTDLDFRAISEKLGFAEQSIFSRSCRRWFDKSPTCLRQEDRLRSGRAIHDTSPARDVPSSMASALSPVV